MLKFFFFLCSEQTGPNLQCLQIILEIMFLCIQWHLRLKLNCYVGKVTRLCFSGQKSICISLSHFLKCIHERPHPLFFLVIPWNKFCPSQPCESRHFPQKVRYKALDKIFFSSVLIKWPYYSTPPTHNFLLFSMESFWLMTQPQCRPMHCFFFPNQTKGNTLLPPTLSK